MSLDFSVANIGLWQVSLDHYNKNSTTQDSYYQVLDYSNTVKVYQILDWSNSVSNIGFVSRIGLKQ